MTFRASGYHAGFTFLKGLALAAGLAVAAQAAPKTDAQIFADYLKSGPYKKYLLDGFNATEPPPLTAKCSKMDLVSTDAPMVQTAPTFAQIGNSYPISTGAWVQRATLNQCGQKVSRRLFIMADPRDGTLHSQALLPGDFPGNAALEHDAPRIVLPGVMAIAKCADWKKLWVLDTKLTTPAKPQGWSEAWTISACGHMVTADVVYLADATGMGITAKNIKVH
ncbi:MAG: hypothetical protein ISS15_12715 [Alphaproteobacteria bacterium]|nr:hypothetical protein [Alphaproteobacteria bacterium]MBL6936437.1 hypothetical protein [Alphaproteobacteria bacterium]MBL7098512.1 hypothetical protein [Alphaproteobacteria bacterium]